MGRNLRGTIPPLSAFTVLTSLNLGDNQLRGTIPPLSDLPALTDLRLHSNLLEGAIPSLSGNTALTLLYLYENQLQGTIPSLSGNTALTLLYLYENQLQGTIPPLNELGALTQLSLSNNRIQGTIPPLAALTALTRLELNYNEIQGKIPALSSLIAMTGLFLSGNQLQGAIPPLIELTALTRLDLSTNKLQGMIPPLSTLTSLTKLDLHANQLSGAFADLTGLKSLAELEIKGNEILGFSECADQSSFELSGAVSKPNEMALYTEFEVTAADEYVERDGRPAFWSDTAGAYFYYHTGNDGMWLVGRTLGGINNVDLAVYSSATHPIDILNSAVWQEFDGPSFIYVFITVSCPRKECADPTSAKSIDLEGAVTRNRLNGFYVQIDVTEANDYTGRDDHPAFYSAAAGAFIYYHTLGGGRWFVASTLGSTSFIYLYVESMAEHPLAISKDAQWIGFDGSGSLTYVPIKLSCSPADKCVPGTYFVADYDTLVSTLPSSSANCEDSGKSDNSMCMRCAAGQTSSGRGAPCEKCPMTTYCLEGAVAPTTCPAGTYGNVAGLGTAECAGSCEKGDFCRASSERPGVCRAGFYCFDSTEEVPCAAGYVSSKGASQCEECLEGKRASADRTICEVCELGKWAASASSSCNACPGGRYGGALLLGAASQCIECDSGKFSDGGAACELCPAGKHSNADLTACEACPEGRHNAFTGLGAAEECTPCSPGTSGVRVEGGATSAEAGCVACSNGKFQDEVGTTTCKTCDSVAGSINIEGSLACNPCPPGSFTNANTGQCVECSAGEFSAGGDVTECTACARGEYSDSNGSPLCTPCLPGTRADAANGGATSCVACPNGKFQDEAGSTACKACDSVAGSINIEGSLACNPCPPGSFTNANTGQCVECSAGEFSAGGDVAACTACARGEYSDSNGSPQCTPCLPGTRADAPNGGATSCVDCPNGEFQDEAGTTACKTCDSVAGSIDVEGSLACNPCPPGSYTNANTGQCVECSAGEFQDAPGTTACKQCVAGTTSLASALYCEQCEAGRYENGGRTECIICAEGTFSPTTKATGSNACQPCEKGTYSTDSRRTCAQCPGGRWSDVEGATSQDTCVKCGEGKFSAARGGFSETICNDCPDGIVSTQVGATSCSENNACAAGQRSSDDGTTCVPCPPGEVSNEGEASCSLCPSGEYAKSDGTECLSCDAGSYCVAGLKAFCSEGQYTSAGSADCLSCPPGKHGTSQRIECALCPEGRFNAAPGVVSVGGCVECGSGTYSRVDRRACEQCVEGRWSSDNGASNADTCTKCVAGKFAAALGATSEEVCNLCPGGKVSTTPGVTTCSTECEAGTRSSDDGTTCEPCLSGSTFQDLSKSSACKPCTKCTPGFRISAQCTETSDTECEECAAGYYSSGVNQVLNCERCDGAGEYASASGSFFCDKARAGYKPNEARTGVEPCPQNTFSIGASDTCTPCESGSSEAGSAACTPCLPGFRTDPETNLCISCEPGTSSTDGAECVPCDGLGEFSATKESVFCSTSAPGTRPNENRTGTLECPKNTYSDAASDNCTVCEFGFSDAGSAACTPCPPGEQISEDKTECVPCAPGFARAYDEDRCSACEAGKVTTFRGSAYCELCLAGTRSNGIFTECVACEPGKKSSAGNDTCFECDEGSYAKGDGTDCIPCPAGRFGDAKGLSDDSCSGDCPAGKFAFRFSTRCLDCEAGKYAQSPGTEDCELCKKTEGFTSTGGATECVCAASRYLDPSGKCVQCSEGMQCASIGTDVEILALQDGFWRQSTETATVLKCPFPDACVASNESVCAVGNEGVLCAVCSDGYYRPSPLAGCSACKGQAIAWLTFIGGLIGVTCVISATIVMNRKLPNGLMRPIISMTQNLSIILLFDAPYPESLKALFKFVAALSLGFDYALPQCISGVDLSYYDSLLGLTAVLVFASLCFTVRPIVKKFKEGLTWRETARTPLGQQSIKDLFVSVLLVHPGLSGKAMEFFRCQEIEGNSYLVKDYSLQCYDSKWYGFLPLVLALLFGFALGTPLAIFSVLYLRRKAGTLYDPETRRPIPQPLDVLYRPYRPGAWYFESVSMLFKVCLWFALVYFNNGSVGQLLVAVFVNAVNTCVTIQVKPNGTRDHIFLNWMQITFSVLLLSLAVGGLAMNALEQTIEIARNNKDTAEEATAGQLKAAIRTALGVLTYALMSSISVYVLNRVYRKLPNSRLKSAVDVLISPVTSLLPRSMRSPVGATDGKNAHSPDEVEIVATRPKSMNMHDNPICPAGTGLIPNTMGDLALPPSPLPQQTSFRSNTVDGGENKGRFSNL